MPFWPATGTRHESRSHCGGGLRGARLKAEGCSQEEIDERCQSESDYLACGLRAGAAAVGAVAVEDARGVPRRINESLKQGRDLVQRAKGLR